MRWLDAIRARLNLLLSRDGAESRIDREFALHLAFETEKLIREQALSPDAARKRAVAAFGGMDQHKETVRDGRGLAWLGGFSLDVKLAFRMLARYPGLTLVGGAAMAFGIAAGVGAFELRRQFVDPVLPLEDGSRIVGVRLWDAATTRPVMPNAEDFSLWRDLLTSIEEVSAATAVQRNLITDDGRSEVVALSAMTASAFRLAGESPLLGRPLAEADELPGADAVSVIGHDIWRDRFASDPEVLGRRVRLGSEQTTIVGVMPEGFRFPAAQSLWVPLRAPTAGTTSERSALIVFGRLAKGVSREQAGAELHAVRVRPGPESETRAHLRSQLVPFGWLVFDPSEMWVGLALANAFVIALLVLVCANVALMMFARAISREGEIAVRSALGAERSRIIMQLFVEALALASIAVAVGLAAARFGLRSFLAMYEVDSGRALPFWMGDRLTPATVVYACTLTIATAVIVGVLPALKATGRNPQAGLRHASPGRGRLQFGGVWTAVIAAQVAATLMFPAAAFFFHRWVIAGQTRDVGIAGGEYLSARLELDDSSTRQRTWGELERRVNAEPLVAGVTFADMLPGMQHPRRVIEVEGDAARSHDVRAASVPVNFFDVFGAPILSGRGFHATDIGSARGVVIVNQSFVTEVLGGQHPVGRRIRRNAGGSQPPGPWLEIAGVVRDLGMIGGEGAGFYQPTTPDAASALRVAIAVKGSPLMFADRFRTVAQEVDPALQVHELMPLDDVGASQWLESQYLSRLLAALSTIALLLSLTAIYSVMAFTVSKRTREIGIRVALGADRAWILGVIMRRPLLQVGSGVVIGGVLVAATFFGLFESVPTITETALIVAYALLMMGVCLLACVVPVRRALRVDPAVVLRVDA